MNSSKHNLHNYRHIYKTTDSSVIIAYSGEYQYLPEICMMVDKLYQHYLQSTTIPSSTGKQTNMRAISTVTVN